MKRPKRRKMTDETDRLLAACRDRIDGIDNEILDLMNRRIAAAKEIAEIKNRFDQSSIYRPEREAQVLRRLGELNRKAGGLLPSAGVETLFREIMSITRGSEAGLSVSLLGPAGTFTEAATRQHFGSAIRLHHLPTIDESIRMAETGETDFAVVPIENSTEGGVSATLDRLTSTSLQICGEIFLKIHHNLISSVDSLSGITRVVAHPQALGQCRHWLSRHLPGVDLMPCSSNIEGVRQAAEEPGLAAIAASAAAETYDLNVLATNIEDEPDNTTRFLVLSGRTTPLSGHDKTSLLLSGRNRPGALFHLLKPLVDAGLDMTKIESRPAKSGLWEYVFFVDFNGHAEDAAVVPVLAEIREEAGLYRLLGSYPAAVLST